MADFRTQIKEIKYLTLNTIELTVGLAFPTDVRFLAGQIMELKFGSVFRAYSIINVPDQNQSLKFCIGLLEKGVASDFFRIVKVGHEIDMRGPSGNFIVNDFSKNYFFIATGVGVAPFVSIVPDMMLRGFEEKVHLLFGVREEEDVFYFDRFTHLQNMYANFKFTPVLSRPKSHWPGETGRVTTYLDVAYEYYKSYVFYISGGIEMVKDVRALLEKKDHDLDKVKLEIFG
jgi:NAD(P)H-flavin reductase